MRLLQKLHQKRLLMLQSSKNGSGQRLFKGVKLIHNRSPMQQTYPRREIFLFLKSSAVCMRNLKSCSNFIKLCPLLLWKSASKDPISCTIHFKCNSRSIFFVFVMLLRSHSILHFNVKCTIWLKGYQNGNHIEPSEQRLQKISIAKN